MQTSFSGSAFKRNEIAHRLICPNCREQPPDIEENFAAGDLVCRGCGLVLGGRIIDQRSEWRTFNTESGGGGVDEDPSRVGGPSLNPLLLSVPASKATLTKADGSVPTAQEAQQMMFTVAKAASSSNLETIISHRDGMTGTSSQLGKAQGRSSTRSPQERLLLAQFRTISALCEKIHLPRAVGDLAKQLFRQASEALPNKLSLPKQQSQQGKNVDSFMAACIYIAARQEQVPRTFKDMSSLLRIPKKDIGKAFKEIQSLVLKNEAMEGIRLDSTFPAYCSSLGLGIEVQKIASLIVNKADTLGMVSGKSPLSVAAVSIFMASHLAGQPRTCKECAEVTGIAETTVKTNYREFWAKKADLVPTEGMTGKLPEPGTTNFL